MSKAEGQGHSPSASGEPWPVLRAMHSRKMHYFICFPDTSPASGGNQTPTSGGLWFINAGNMLCLAELVWWSRLDLSMYEVYRMWLGLPMLAHRRKHSESQSDQAQLVRNAKKLQHQEWGNYGLNSREGRQRRK